MLSIRTLTLGMMLLGAGAVATSFGAAAPAAEAEHLALNITPRVAGAPATVRVTVTVEPDAENRLLLIAADSDGYYRSSQITLEGDQAARTHTLMFSGLPPGDYDVVATVRTQTGQTSSVHSTVSIVGMQGP